MVLEPKNNNFENTQSHDSSLSNSLENLLDFLLDDVVDSPIDRKENIEEISKVKNVDKTALDDKNCQLIENSLPTKKQEFKNITNESKSVTTTSASGLEDAIVEVVEDSFFEKKDEETSERLISLEKDWFKQPKNPEIQMLRDWILEKESQLDDLASSMNNLIPLIVELLKVKNNDTREAILRAIVPVIDQIIEERSSQDNESMAAAIAKILPTAISKEIQTSPQSIAKAIAPEVALSIQEQILLDKDAISQALGSEMGKAIKAQIELERDAMVDALYPVIGSTISKYMVEVVQSINDRVENALSLEGFSRKIRAKLQGVSEAELILQEAIGCSIRAIFLIHKGSGLIIQELQPDKDKLLESDLIAGMLTAIRSFANDCIASGSELDAIDYGDCQILLEVAGYCYLAVVVKGEPNQKLRDRIRQTMNQIVSKYAQIMENYNGDSATVPTSINALLEQLVEAETNQNKPQKSPKALFWLGAILFSGIVIPWLIFQHRNNISSRIEQEVAVALDSNPNLSIYRLTPEVNQGNLTLTGKVPSEYLRDLANNIGSQFATQENLQLNNQIISVKIPPDPTFTSQEVVRITALFNQKQQIAIATNYQDGVVTIDGFILDQKYSEIIANAFAVISGIEQVILLADNQLPQIETQIYFDSGKIDIPSSDKNNKINSVVQFLNKYPTLHLRIIGHSDAQGSKETNEKLALARANKVYQEIIAQKVTPERLEVVSSVNLPPNLVDKHPLFLSRCVRFEVFINEQLIIDIGKP